MKRRRFIQAAALCVCGGCATSRQVPPAANEARSAGSVSVGSLGRFNTDGIYGNWAASHGFYVVRRENRLFALAGFCTHQSDTRLNPDPRGVSLVCPRHGARFSADGAVMKGPAQQRLALLGIRADAQGRVWVDPGRTFTAGDPASEGASIPMGG